MNRFRRVGFSLVGAAFAALTLHEFSHFHRYGHFVPLGLHADVSITTSSEVLGVEGTAKIYRAQVTNYGVFPSSFLVCGERVAGALTTEVNYIVERWDRQSGEWRAVPEWDFGGYRLFCRPVFEVTEEHVVRRWLWPGRSLDVGQGIPGQLGGFHVGDDGRFTIFLRADGNKANAISTSGFRVDQEPKKATSIGEARTTSNFTGLRTYRDLDW